MFLRQEANIICTIQVMLLNCHVMPVLRPPYYHLSYDPDDNHRKDHLGTASSLADFCAYFESFGTFPTVSCGGSLRFYLNKRRWNSIAMHKLSDDIPFNTVKGLSCISLDCSMIILRISSGWQYGQCRIYLS